MSEVTECMDLILRGFTGLQKVLEGKFTATREEVLLARHGTTCSVLQAMKELGRGRHAINTMVDDGRLKRVGNRIDVISMARYMEDAKNNDFWARIERRRTRTAAKPTRVPRE